jgi:acyl-CoA thioester hydrolase
MTSPFKAYATLKVRFNDTDLQGHVYFGNYYAYFDEGVEAYMAAIGYDYDMMLADATDFLYAESHCTYKSPARHPELLRVYTRVGHLGRRSLRFEFEVRQDAGERLVAAGHIVAVTANSQTFEPQPIPDGLRRAITAFEGEFVS